MSWCLSREHVRNTLQTYLTPKLWITKMRTFKRFYMINFDLDAWTSCKSDFAHCAADINANYGKDRLIHEIKNKFIRSLSILLIVKIPAVQWPYLAMHRKMGWRLRIWRWTLKRSTGVSLRMKRKLIVLRRPRPGSKTHLRWSFLRLNKTKNYLLSLLMMLVITFF